MFNLKVRKSFLIAFFVCLTFMPFREVAYFSRLSEMQILMNGNLYSLFEKLARITALGQRVLIGLLIGVALIKLLKNMKRMLNSISFTVSFAAVAVIFVVISYINKVQIVSLFNNLLGTIVYIGFLEYNIRNNHMNVTLKAMAVAYAIVLTLNTVCFIMYPEGIFIDLAKTRYNLLGMDNQMTPFLLMSFFLGTLYSEITDDKKLGKFLSVLSIINVLLFQSGNALLAIFLFCIYRVLFYDSKLRKYVSNKTLIITYVIATGLIVVLNLSSAIVGFADLVFNKGANVASRFRIWASALLQIQDRFLLGYGYGHKVYGHYYAHNGILELFVLGGVVLAGAYILLIAKSAKAITPYSSHKLGNFAMFSLLVLLIANVAEAFLFDMYQIVFLLLINLIGVFIQNTQCDSILKS